MSFRTGTVFLDVTVFDVEALAHAAEKKALETMTAEEWVNLRDYKNPIASDLQMLLDPGSIEGAGISIENSSVELADIKDDA